MTHEEILHTETTLSIVRGTRRITHRQHAIGNQYYAMLMDYKKAYDAAYGNAQDMLRQQMSERWMKVCEEYVMLQDGTAL